MNWSTNVKLIQIEGMRVPPVRALNDPTCYFTATSTTCCSLIHVAPNNRISKLLSYIHNRITLKYELFNCLNFIPLLAKFSELLRCIYTHV